MTDKSTLEVALQNASNGFRVIRLTAGQKDPPIDMNYPDVATDDPARICTLWHCSVTGWEQDYNVAISTDYLCAVDIDVKKTNGFETLQKAGIELPRTRTHGTPSSGQHHIYKTSRPVANRQCRKDLPGIDIRGWHGYVLAPGATFEGGEYTVIDDVEIIDLPPDLFDKLGLQYADTAKKIDWGQQNETAKDDPVDIARAVEWLRTLAPSTDGEARNNELFKVMANVRDLGISLKKARDLAWEHYRDRCTLHDDEFNKTIKSAYRYTTNEQGTASVASDFGDIVEDKTEEKTNDDVFATGFRTYRVPQEPEKLPIMRWVIPALVAPGHASLLVAPGGSGKSLLTLSLALAVATGDGSHIGMEVRERGPVVIISGEDDDDVLNRRLYAAIQHHKIDPAAIGDRIIIMAGRKDTHSARILTKNKAGNLVVTPFARKMGPSLKARGALLAIFDPLVKFHEAEENSNTEMNILGDAFCTIAEQGACAVLTPHHTRKPSGASSEGFAGNQDVSRGAGALTAAFRVSKTFFGASPQDAKKLGILEGERDRFVRLDNAKQNHERASKKAKWYYIESVRIPNGEEVAALRPISLTEFEQRDRALYAKLLIPLLEANPEGISVKEAAEIISDDEIFVDETTKNIAHRINVLFAESQTVDDWSIWVDKPEGAKKASMLHGHVLTP